MNKQFFAITLLALVSQLQGMEKDLYPHDYVCAKHRYNVSYPHPIEIVRLTAALTHKYEPKEFWVNRKDDEWFDRFQDGKAPLVIALKDFHNYCQTKELESSNQKITQETAQLCQLLARPIGFDGNYLPPQENNFYWNRLRNQLTNPNIIRWENMLNERPDLWKEAEKAALSANVLGSRKPDYFKKLLVPNIAKFLAAVFNAQSLFYCLKLDEKDVIINQERAAKEVAQRALGVQQDNEAALRILEPQTDNLLLELRKKIGSQAFDFEAGGIIQNPDPALLRTITERTQNPSSTYIQEMANYIQGENSEKLCELIITLSKVDSTRAKALIKKLIAHVSDVTIAPYASPLIARLTALRTQKTTVEEQNRKLQADLEAERKSKADMEARKNQEIEDLRNQKNELSEHFDRDIRQLGLNVEQRNEQTRATLRALRSELSPLRRELPVLRAQKREQEELITRQRIELEAFKNMISSRIHQP